MIKDRKYKRNDENGPFYFAALFSLATFVSLHCIVFQFIIHCFLSFTRGHAIFVRHFNKQVDHMIILLVDMSLHMHDQSPPPPPPVSYYLISRSSLLDEVIIVIESGKSVFFWEQECKCINYLRKKNTNNTHSVNWGGGSKYLTWLHELAFVYFLSSLPSFVQHYFYTYISHFLPLRLQREQWGKSQLFQ